MLVIHATWEAEDCKFKANLGNLARSCLKIKLKMVRDVAQCFRAPSLVLNEKKKSHRVDSYCSSCYPGLPHYWLNTSVAFPPLGLCTCSFPTRSVRPHRLAHIFFMFLFQHHLLFSTFHKSLSHLPPASIHTLFIFLFNAYHFLTYCILFICLLSVSPTGK